MTRDEIIARLKELEPALRARGITRLQMFGSRARGDNREDSDVDLLVRYKRPENESGFDFFGIGADLTEELGIETQITTDDPAAKPRFFREIEKDLIDIFPASGRSNRPREPGMAAQRRTALRLNDVLEAITDIRSTLNGESFDSFRENRLKMAAVNHFLLIISEASRNLPSALKSGSAEVPLKKVAGIGNILRHGYFLVDVEVVWDIYAHHLDTLEAAIRAAQADYPDVGD
jgi:uncharacterized protein with HEPN domain/predicted nucleotidyltransferase